MAVLFTRREEKLNGEQKEYPQRLCASDQALADACRRTSPRWSGTSKGRSSGWLEEAAGCEASAMKKFAAGLQKDLPAVRPGLTERWSNGPVERCVNKPKLVKRQGYGKAGLGLLRARVLAA